MLTAHQPFQYLGDDGIQTARAVPPDVLLRRLMRRRRILKMVAASFLVDVILLLLYVGVHAVPASIVVAYSASCVAFLVIFGVASETGINDRFKDHYLGVLQATAASLQMLGFLYLAPEVGALFICTLFVVISFSALRSTLAQGAITWTVVIATLAVELLVLDLTISIPHGTQSENIVTFLVLATAFARCTIIGSFASAQRDLLYQRGIALSVANRRIEELAELDELTGSFNRRCIMRMLDEEIARAHRSGAPLCVALIDLDWFKRINDTYGHPTGDEVLKTFAITVFANIRGIDRFGRYGGEEFLLLLPDTSHDMATQMLDRLRALITMLDWSAFSDGLTVTISAGVATLDPAETAEALLARTDVALYEAKKLGRNRIAKA